MATVDESQPAAPDGQHWVATFDGRRLTAARQARSWTQVRLAEELHRLRVAAVAPTNDTAPQLRTLIVQVSCYESGRTRPRAATVRDLATVLGVEALDLLAAETPITLATLRARLGLTQAAVATVMAMSRSLYAHVEQRRRPLSHQERSLLAAVLQTDGVTIDRALEPVSEPTERPDDHAAQPSR